MMASEEYSRLTGTGLWRATADAQRRDVELSFGRATLVIGDRAGRPLAHWSLPAVKRINPGALPAIYAPDAATDETVEISDASMIDALERIARGIARAQPRRGRLRTWGRLAVLALTGAAAFIWLPGALTLQTINAVPLSKRTEIGATLLGHMQRQTGATCRNPLGVAALASLHARLLGREATGQVVVVPTDIPGAVYLPGGIIVLSRAMIEGTDDPAVVAGHILAAALSRPEADPLAGILDTAGFMATLTLLTTGDLPAGTLEAQAAAFITDTPPLAGPDRLVQGFDAADVPLAPWATSSGRPQSEMAAYVRAAADAPPTSGAQLLNDGNWISLQGICVQ